MPELFYKQDGHAYKKPTLHLAANVIKYTKKERINQENEVAEYGIIKIKLMACLASSLNRERY
jgi:hypothetical protein